MYFDLVLARPPGTSFTVDIRVILRMFLPVG